MALFSVDALPERSDQAALERLEAEGLMMNLPRYAIGMGVIVFGACLIVGELAGAVLVPAAAFAGLKWLYFGNPAIKRLHQAKDAIELKYPSIVVQMRSHEVPA